MIVQTIFIIFQHLKSKLYSLERNEGKMIKNFLYYNSKMKEIIRTEGY